MIKTALIQAHTTTTTTTTTTTAAPPCEVWPVFTGNPILLSHIFAALAADLKPTRGACLNVRPPVFALRTLLNAQLTAIGVDGEGASEKARAALQVVLASDQISTGFFNGKLFICKGEATLDCTHFPHHSANTSRAFHQDPSR